MLVFASIFNGLQRYGFPTALYTATRVGSAVALVIIVLLRGSLVEMAVTIAIFNVLQRPSDVRMVASAA